MAIIIPLGPNTTRLRRLLQSALDPTPMVLNAIIVVFRIMVLVSYPPHGTSGRLGGISPVGTSPTGVVVVVALRLGRPGERASRARRAVSHTSEVRQLP